MPHAIRFVPEAETELAEARVWYGLQRDGLDVELMQRIDETLERISHAPRRYPRVHQQLRRAIVRQFPFAICGLDSFLRASPISNLKARNGVSGTTWLPYFKITYVETCDH